MFRIPFRRAEKGSRKLGWLYIYFGTATVTAASMIGYQFGVFADDLGAFGIGVVAIGIGVRELIMAKKQSQQGSVQGDT